MLLTKQIFHGQDKIMLHGSFIVIKFLFDLYYQSYHGGCHNDFADAEFQIFLKRV